MTFIRLTSKANDTPVLVNIDRVNMVYYHDESTIVHFGGDDYRSVKETLEMVADAIIAAGYTSGYH